MTKYGPWKIWNGGECPVDPETEVQFQLAGETRLAATKRPLWVAKDAVWRYGSGIADNDIIAYREVIELVVETKEYRYGVGGLFGDEAPIVSYTNFGEGFTPGTAKATIIDGKLTRLVWEPDQ